MRIFTKFHNQKCAKCKRSIAYKAAVEWTRGVPVVHAECANAATPVVASLAVTVAAEVAIAELKREEFEQENEDSYMAFLRDSYMSPDDIDRANAAADAEWAERWQEAAEES